MSKQIRRIIKLVPIAALVVVAWVKGYNTGYVDSYLEGYKAGCGAEEISAQTPFLMNLFSGEARRN